MQTVNIRVAFATPHQERAEFLIGLNPARATEAQMMESLKRGVLYEQCTSWVMMGLLRPGDIAIDVGAHVGYYTLLMRTLVGARGQVWAAEPMPESYVALLANISRNNFTNVYAKAAALSSSVGVADFAIHALNEGESHLAAGGERGSATVATTTLDAWLAELARPARLVKLDAEGCEALILAGGEAYFAQQAPDAVICEINPPALARYGSSPALLCAQFAALNYRPYLINVAQSGPYDLCQGAILKPLSSVEDVDVKVVYNLLFCRPGVKPKGLGI